MPFLLIAADSKSFAALDELTAYVQEAQREGTLKPEMCLVVKGTAQLTRAVADRCLARFNGRHDAHPITDREGWVRCRACGYQLYRERGCP